MIIANGSTDVTQYFVLRDSTTHAPKTDVTITDIDLYYLEQGAAISAKVDATALDAADSAHADNKAFHCGQGMYRIDWPDAAFDGGIGKRVFLIVVCSGVDTSYLEIELSPAANVKAISDDATAADVMELFAEALDQSTGQVDSGSIAANAITVTAIADDAITAAKLNTGAITADAFAANAITNAAVADDVDVNVKTITAGAITSAAIATGAIDADAVAADAITAIWAKAMSDLAAVPGATASVLDAINLLFELARNKLTQTADTQTLYKDNGSTALATSTVSDDATTFTRTEFTTVV